MGRASGWCVAEGHACALTCALVHKAGPAWLGAEPRRIYDPEPVVHNSEGPARMKLSS